MISILFAIKVLLVAAGVVLVFQGGSLMVLSLFLDSYKRNRSLYAVTLALGLLLIVMAFLLIPS